MKLPNELYVQVEGEGEDEFLNAQEDAEMFAEIGETVVVALYRKVGTVKIKSSTEIIGPKET